jgi:uncharacterized damage-inducible protein DinB
MFVNTMPSLIRCVGFSAVHETMVEPVRLSTGKIANPGINDDRNYGMKRTLVATVMTLLAVTPALARGQVVSSLAGIHAMTKQSITATADLVSEDLYGFRPTEEVRTLGQILAHIADANYQICSAASGQSNPNTESLEQTKTSKAEITQALADAFAYCEGVYGSMSDAQGAETVPFLGGQDLARSAVLAFNSTHSYEHYGNLVTYMRINGITPPTSQ